jgi:hypothetical protein
LDHTSIMIKKIFTGFAAAIALFLSVSVSQAHGSSKSDDRHETEAQDVDEDHDDDNSGSGSDSDKDEPEDEDRDDNSGSGSRGDDEDKEDNSGSGSSGDSDKDDNSGSGSSGSDRDDKSSLSTSSSESRSTGDLRTTGEKVSSESRVARAEFYLEVIENKRGERVLKGELVLLSSRAGLGRKLASKGFKVIETFHMPSLGLAGFRISVPSRANTEQMLAKLKLVDPKGIATFNHVYEPARGGATISSTTSVAMAPVGKRVQAKIGLVDARVNANHPMLRNVHVSSKTFGIASSSDEEHGTAVASRLAEAAPGASLVVASVFSALSNGQEMASVVAITKALHWLSVNNVPVINMSLAGPPNPILEAMTAKLIAKGHVLVAAVGNEGPHASPQYPAAYSDVVGVTAVDSENKIYLYANQGDYVDFAAPGVNTRVAANESDLETVSGTSYAAPVVAAALARRLKQPDPYLARRAERELAKSAQDVGEPGRDPVYGFGIVSGIER